MRNTQREMDFEFEFVRHFRNQELVMRAHKVRSILKTDFSYLFVCCCGFVYATPSISLQIDFSIDSTDLSLNLWGTVSVLY